MSYKPIALNNISCSLLYHYDDKDDVYSIGNIEKDKYIEVKESNKDAILYTIKQLNGKNTIDEVEQLVYFILNLCAKFSLKSQPSIYGKYGKWIL